MSTDDLFINYYLSKRVMKRTPKPDDLHQIYAKKYSNWIAPYLNSHGIKNAPMMLFCHTLYQLPDFFTIGNNSFFVIDYYLYSFIYDFNYSLIDVDHEEFAINLYIKTYIEQAYVRGKIDLCFCLCATSPGIEEYKKSDAYRNEETMTYLVDKTDLQEAFTLLHEANHFLYKNSGSMWENENYHVIVKMFSSVKSIRLDDVFYEECLCDYESILYVLSTTYHDTKLLHSEYFGLFFDVLTCTYVIQFFMKCQDINLSIFENFIDNQMQMLSLRFISLQSAIYTFLQWNNHETDLPLLETAFQSSVERFKTLGSDIRIISGFIEKEIRKKIKAFEDVSEKEKLSFIKDYLLLLS